MLEKERTTHEKLKAKWSTIYFAPQANQQVAQFCGILSDFIMPAIKVLFGLTDWPLAEEILLTIWK
jgi:hypothetical protein